MVTLETLVSLEDREKSSIVRHLDGPFSDTALTEDVKVGIDLGAIDMASQEPNKGRSLKRRDREAEIPNDIPDEIVRAHKLFIDASRLILGEEAYLSSLITFTYRDNPVEPGGSQIPSRPHIDGLSRDPALKMVGVACSSLPLLGLHGRYKRSELKEDGSLRSVVALNKRFTKLEVPERHLVLMPPSLLHEPARAASNTGRPVDRIFYRWHLVSY
jgi:hypothetical protein